MNTGRRFVLLAGPTLLGLALTGCGATPARYYQMAAAPGALAGNGPPTLEVRGVSIPGALDQNNIVRPSGAYEFASYDDQLWAEPLADMLQAVMVQDLALRLPNSTVTGSGGAIAGPRNALVEINVLDFAPDASGRVTLSMQLAVKSGRDNTLWLTRSFQQTATPATAPAGDEAAAEVAAMSTLWGAAADQAAAMLAQSWAIHAGD